MRTGKSVDAVSSEQFGECCQCQAQADDPGPRCQGHSGPGRLCCCSRWILDRGPDSWVLRTMEYRVQCTHPAWAASQVTTQTWEHGTSDISSEWLWCVSVSRSSCQDLGVTTLVSLSLAPEDKHLVSNYPFVNGFDNKKMSGDAMRNHQNISQIKSCLVRTYYISCRYFKIIELDKGVT